MVKNLFILLICIGFQIAHANVEQSWDHFPKERSYFSPDQKLVNFAVPYMASWSFYLVDQNSIIKDHGSFENWFTNPTKPHFDRDSFDYNIFKHSLAGASFYLWFRSRGYEVQNAFIWTFLTSLAFEFTIETVTERPSYQDIYQTPVFGTVLGIGVEKLSRYFHSWDNWLGHGLGYITDPFTLIPQQKEIDLSVIPVIDANKQGLYITYRY